VVITTGLLSAGRTDYATGWDGYYYLVQVKSLSSTGEMHSPEYSLIYLPLVAAHAITGDYISAYRISEVLVKLVFVLSIFSVTLALVRLSGGKGRGSAFFTALLAASVSAASPSMNYFFTQFPKNLLGFAMFFYFMACVFGAVRLRKEKESSSSALYLRISGAFLFFLAAFFTHRFSAVLSLLFLALFFAPSCWSLLKRKLAGDGRKQGRLRLAAALIFLLLLLVLFISDKLPLAPSLRDMERITGDLSLKPSFVPAAFIGTFGWSRLGTPWLVEIFAATALLVLSCILLLYRKRSGFPVTGRGYSILIVLSLTGLFPFLEFSLMGLSCRLFFCTLLMMPLICIPYIRKIVDRSSAMRRSAGKLENGIIPAAVFLILLAVSFITSESYRPEIHDPPYSFYEELADEAIEALSVRDFELIIAHKALAEMITFKYGIDALSWAPEEYFLRERTWRITAGILEDEFSYYLSPEAADSFYIRLSGDYGLLREDKWETFMENISDDPVMTGAVNIWRNPLERRPSYLINNRQSP